MVEPAAVLAAQRDGIEALAGFGATADEALWTTPVCGVWDGAALAGHVLVVAGWYHEWLDRALAGESDPPFSDRELATRNQHALNGLEPSSGPARLVAFRRRATEYADRVADHWDLPYGFPAGTVTAGEHAALAAMEWHAHAWDLARGAGADHRPVDADLLAAAVIAAWAKRGDRVGRTVDRGLGPVARRLTRDPWRLLLRGTGRRP